METNTKPLDLENIEVAFKGKTDGELKKAYCQAFLRWRKHS